TTPLSYIFSNSQVSYHLYADDAQLYISFPPVLMLIIIFQFYLLLSTLSILGLRAIVSQSILPKQKTCLLVTLNNVQNLLRHLLPSVEIILFQLIAVEILELYSTVNFLLKNISPVFAQPLSTISASFAKSVLHLIQIQP